MSGWRARTVAVIPPESWATTAPVIYEENPGG